MQEIKILTDLKMQCTSTDGSLSEYEKERACARYSYLKIWQKSDNEKESFKKMMKCINENGIENCSSTGDNIDYSTHYTFNNWRVNRQTACLRYRLHELESLNMSQKNKEKLAIQYCKD